MRTRFPVLSALVLLVAAARAQSVNFSTLTGPYMGQKAPGQAAEIFAEGFVAKGQRSFHTNIVFTPQGDEAYWAMSDKHGKSRRIVVSRSLEGHWTDPRIASFSMIDRGDDAPFVSPDGKTLYFLSKRPISRGAEAGKENIWSVERTSDGWSDPRPLPPVVNSKEGLHWQFSVDAAGNLYFGRCQDLFARVREGKVYCSPYADGRYAEPRELESSINGKGYNCCPYVVPDGHTLLFAREDAETHEMRIWVSFQKEDGRWGEALDLSGVLGNKDQNCPIGAPDGRSLFFLRYVDSFCQPFWIDAGRIWKLRPAS